jgi:hypothetical protein
VRGDSDLIVLALVAAACAIEAILALMAGLG